MSLFSKIDALIVNVARPEGLEAARSAHQVIPPILLVYLGARGDERTTGRLSLPPGEFVPLPLLTEDLTRALTGSSAGTGARTSK